MNGDPNDTPRLRTLVVEDEWPARNYLVELLESSKLAEVVGAVASSDEARLNPDHDCGLTVERSSSTYS